MLVSGCSDNQIAEITYDDDREDEMIVEDAKLVSEIVESDEFKNLNQLHQRSMNMLFDALDNGVTKESLSKAFKAEIGIIDNEGDTIPLSRFFPEEHMIEVRETARSLVDRFPVFAEIQNEPGFSERCEMTSERIDGFLENLDQLRNTQYPTAYHTLNKISDEDEGCQACGGGEGACGDMIRVYACGFVGAWTGGWVGFVGGLWLCGCTWCEEDLPKWACGRE